MSKGFLNPQLLRMASQLHKEAKQAFVDPATMTGGGAQGPDPSQQGAAPPGMDPSMMGGQPPADPAAGGGGGGDALMGMISQMQQQISQIQQGGGAAAGGGAGAGAGAAGGLKPKIDVNVTMLQILKILAKIADGLGIQIPASEMVATSNDLNQFAQQQQTAQSAPPSSAISAISPVQGASPAMASAGGGEKQSGVAFDPAEHFVVLSDKASAMQSILSHRMSK